MRIYKQYFQKNTGREFPIYGYSPPPQGEWWIDDTTFTTEDFRTVERYKEYKDCGFNILFMQSKKCVILLQISFFYIYFCKNKNNYT